MPIPLTAEVDAAPLLGRLRTLNKHLPPRRKEATRRLARDILASTIRHNPVDTARSRAAWVASLERLEGVPPAGWKGPHPEAAAIAEGTAAAALEIIDTPHTTEIRVANAVPYVLFLELGTRAMSPFAMVRRSFAEARHRLRQLFSSITRPD